MGTALRSISLRIRGYSESSEDDALEIDDDLKTISGDLIDLTKTAQHSQGISIFKEGSTTEFKSLVDYLGEVSEIWDEMDQAQQNAFLNKAFAKTQAQAGAAIIKNYESVREALKAMEEAGGSAASEMEIVKQTLSYKQNALKQTWVQIAQDLVDRGAIGDLIDLLTRLSEAIEKVASSGAAIPTLVGALGGLWASSNNVGKPKLIGFVPRVCRQVA